MTAQPDAPRAERASRHAATASRLRLVAIAANTAFFLLLLLAIFVMIKQKSPAGSILMAVGGAGWWAAGKVRLLRIRHLERASGYENPSAEEVRAACLAAGRPFAIFLRGFDVDRALVRRHGFLIDLGSYQASGGTRRVEMFVAKLIGEECPLLALPDPRDPGPIPGAYRFENVPENWEAFVKQLIYEASLVMVHASNLTPGLKRELELLAAGAVEKTVVVIQAASRNERRKLGPELAKMLETFPRIAEDRQERALVANVAKLVAEVTGATHPQPQAIWSHDGAQLWRRISSYLLAPTLAGTLLFAFMFWRGDVVDWVAWPVFVIGLILLESLFVLLWLGNRASYRWTESMFNRQPKS